MASKAMHVLCALSVLLFLPYGGFSQEVVADDADAADAADAADGVDGRPLSGRRRRRALLESGVSGASGDDLADDAVSDKESGDLMDPAFLQDLLHLKLTPEVRVVMNDTALLVQPLFSKVENASDADKALLANLISEFGQVTSSFQDANATAAGLLTAVGTGRSEHMLCRQAESTLTGEANVCQVSEDSSSATLTSNLLDLFAKHNQVSSDFSPVSAPNLLDVTAGTLGSLLAVSERYIDANKNFVHTQDQHSQVAQECNSSRAASSSKKTECDVKQGEFEAAVCQHGREAEAACTTYTTEFNRLLSQYSLVSTSVQVRALDRQYEWTHLNRVYCVLEGMAKLKHDGSLVSKHPEITLCYNKTFDNPQLVIPEAPAPTLQPCPAAPAWACSAQFLQEEYSHMPNGTVAASCAACPETAPSPTPTAAPIV